MVEESMARAGIEEMELDESNPPRDDFLWWSYHVSGENPAAWQVSAKDLLDGAMAVKAKVQPFDNAMHSLARVEAMLLGMALECLLKGMYIRRHRVWADPAKEHALVKDGKYVRVKGAGDHELVQLAKAAGVTLSQPEQSILTRLTDFIKYVRIPLMMITDSGLMVISSERSDAGVFMIPEVIGMGQGLGSIRSLADESSSSRFSLFWGCEA